jgi:hypothetical protein
MLSSMPAVFPSLNPPAAIPPTVAGPIIYLLFSLAILINSLVLCSGTPSAIIATVLIFLCSNA